MLLYYVTCGSCVAKAVWELRLVSWQSLNLHEWSAGILLTDGNTSDALAHAHDREIILCIHCTVMSEKSQESRGKAAAACLMPLAVESWACIVCDQLQSYPFKVLCSIGFTQMATHAPVCARSHSRKSRASDSRKSGFEDLKTAAFTVEGQITRKMGHV